MRKSPSFFPMWFAFWSRMICSCLSQFRGFFYLEYSMWCWRAVPPLSFLGQAGETAKQQPSFTWLPACHVCDRIRALLGQPMHACAVCLISPVVIFPCSILFSATNVSEDTPLSLQQLTKVVVVCETKRCTLSSLTYYKIQRFFINQLHPLPLHARCLNSKPTMEMKTAWGLV